MGDQRHPDRKHPWRGAPACDNGETEGKCHVCGEWLPEEHPAVIAQYKYWKLPEHSYPDVCECEVKP